MTKGFSESAMQAILQLNDELLEQELQNGIDLHAEDDAGDTLLHVAATWGKPSSIGLLVAAGADLNRRDAKSRTPLYRAVLDKIGENVRALIGAGADLNVVDSENTNALFRAIYLGEVDIALLLTARGAEVDVEALNDGGTPLLWAVGRDSAELVRALVDRGANIHHPGILQAAAFAKRIDHLQFLLERGAQIDARNRYGATCLHVAAGSGSLEVMEWLLARGADPTLRDARELTALDWAVNSMQDEAARVMRRSMENAGAKPISVYDVSNPTDPDGIALLERTRAFLQDYEAWNAAACDIEERNCRGSLDSIREQFAALLKKYGVDSSRKGLISCSRDCDHSASSEQLWKVHVDNARGIVYSRMRGRFNRVTFYEYEFVRRSDAWALEQVWTVFGPKDREPLIVQTT